MIKELKMLTSSNQKGMWVGYILDFWMYANSQPTGILKPPKSLKYDRRNRVSLYARLIKRQVDRKENC